MAGEQENTIGDQMDEMAVEALANPSDKPDEKVTGIEATQSDVILQTIENESKKDN